MNPKKKKKAKKPMVWSAPRMTGMTGMTGKSDRMGHWSIFAICEEVASCRRNTP